MHRGGSYDSQNLPNELPALGGTNPYPLAPTTTPLVSAELGGGPGGNNIGPTDEKRVRCSPYSLTIIPIEAALYRSHDCVAP